MPSHVYWTEPRIEMKRVPRGVKWCFKCRKYLPHDRVLMGHPIPDPFPEVGSEAWETFVGSQASVYEPEWEWQCSGCGQDHTRMFG